MVVCGPRRPSGGPRRRGPVVRRLAPPFVPRFWFGRLGFCLKYMSLSPCLVQKFVSFVPSWLVYLSQSTTGAGFGDTPGHPGSASLDAGFRSRFAGCGWDCSHSFLCLLGRICCFEENIAIFGACEFTWQSTRTFCPIQRFACILIANLLGELRHRGELPPSACLYAPMPDPKPSTAILGVCSCTLRSSVKHRYAKTPSLYQP